MKTYNLCFPFAVNYDERNSRDPKEILGNSRLVLTKGKDVSCVTSAGNLVLGTCGWHTNGDDFPKKNPYGFLILFLMAFFLLN